MKKLWFGILATLLLTVFVAPAFAWDFTMSGQFEWRFQYFGRANGYQDLFGDMRLQDSLLTFPAGTGPIGFAGPNFYRGYNGNTSTPMMTSYWGDQIKIVRGGFSYADSDAYAHDQRMTFLPEIRINNAIRLRGVFDLASIRQKYNHRDYETNGPLDRWYQDRTSANAFDTAMIPSFSQWHASAQLPWGVVQLGARDFPWGAGAVIGFNTRNDSLLFVLPYGPFRFIPQIWLANQPNGFGAFTPYAQAVGFNPTSPGANTVVNYDGGEHYSLWWSVVSTYDSGPLTLGFGFLHLMQHLNNVNVAAVGGLGAGYRPVYNQGALNPANTVFGYGGQDQAGLAWTTFLKYNNGRFFTNLEYWWGNVDYTFLGYGTNPRTTVVGGHTILAATASGAPPLYIEGSMAFAELGALCGPAKLTGMFAWSAGPALNNGNPTKMYLGIPINYQATDPYNFLMFHTYGGGNDAPWNAGIPLFNKDEYGMMADAYALAARLDYAVAANLNIWGSYMWANRVEQNGWLAGQKNSSGNPATGTGFAGTWTAADAQNWKIASMPGGGGNMNPYVDDGYLGWEAQAGVDWKLLENMTVMSRYAYWQPGPWFDQAYQVVGLNAGGAATASGFMQGRSAIQAFTSSVMIDF
jgi:hypothetical protein